MDATRALADPGDRTPAAPLALLAALAVLPAACAPARPPHPRAVEEVRRGYAHLAAGDRERAEIAFEHSLEIEPSLPEAQNGMGIALRLEGRTGAARAWWEAAAAAGLAEARTNLGEALAADGREDAALEAFAEALRFDPDLPAPRLDRARLLLRRGLATRGGERAAWLALARRDLLHLVEAHGDLAEAHRDLGYVAWAQGDAALSAASYGRAAEVAAGDADAHHGHCAALVLLGRCAEAAAACRRCLAVDPLHARCRTSLAGARACAARPAAPGKTNGAPLRGAPSTSLGSCSGDR
jgi:tetratricopeptide (TPR) repeat protein